MIAIVGLGVLGARVCKRLPRDLPLLLIDHDVVVEKNIHRQYPQECLGLAKPDACGACFHPDAELAHKHLDMTTVGLLAEASLVVDCTDNMVTRYVINDYCAREGIPWIHGALADTAGTVATFSPGGPCFACLYPAGTGETCTERLDLSIADETADIIVLEIRKALHGELESVFIRVTKKDCTPYTRAKRPGCPTCAGQYPWLSHERQFYITYCAGSKCMAAKPVRPRQHDHGVAKRMVVDGVPLSVFPNGEIHFHKELDADHLLALAEKVYATAR